MEYQLISIKRQFVLFILRFAFTTFGLWISIRLLSEHGLSFTGHIYELLFAGFVLSVINAVIRPLIVIFSLPAILLTLGLFMFVVNGFMVYLAALAAPEFNISFGAAMVAGLIIGLVNYALSGVLELSQEKSKKVE